MSPTLESKAATSELLSPAGSPAAAYAAFQYGADAIYLGLKNFSARANAVNFTLPELSAVCAFGHNLPRRRSIFVALNTLFLSSELEELLEIIQAIKESQVDALIVQDLGIFYIVKKYFPEIPIHASTQLGIHNVAGAEAARQLGFDRVILARELSLEEIADISQKSAIDTEVFIHGALCYSYSGLCLFSARATGRSANRGQCSQPCRELYHEKDTSKDDQSLFFSMKDLLASEIILKLREAGVRSFKIEGRKKSPLYVAAATAYYRGILDGTLDPKEWRELEADLKAIFSRAPSLGGLTYTKDSPIEIEYSGPRGSHLGQVSAITRAGGVTYISFRTERAIQIYDGILIEIPGSPKPFGFPVKTLQILDARNNEFRPAMEAAGETEVKVALPQHYPQIEIGFQVTCNSSQQAAKRFPLTVPQERNLRVRTLLAVKVKFSSTSVEVRGQIEDIVHSAQAEIELAPARSSGSNYRGVFEQLSETPFQLGQFELVNPENLFCPVSVLKKLRKELCRSMEEILCKKRKVIIEDLLSEIKIDINLAKRRIADKAGSWFVKSDNPALLEQLALQSTSEITEVVLAIDNLSLDKVKRFEASSKAFSNVSVRYALPPVIRAHDKGRLIPLINWLLDNEALSWEVASLGTLSLLRERAGKLSTSLNVSSDWSCYVTNPTAAIQLLDLGIERLTLSPEDDLSNVEKLAATFPGLFTLIVYQDTPLFLSDFCSRQLCSSCQEASAAKIPLRRLQDVRRNNYLLYSNNCRSILIAENPYSLGGMLSKLYEENRLSFRVDFLTRAYTIDQSINIIETLKRNAKIPLGA